MSIRNQRTAGTITASVGTLLITFALFSLLIAGLQHLMLESRPDFGSDATFAESVGKSARENAPFFGRPWQGLPPPDPVNEPRR